MSSIGKNIKKIRGVKSLNQSDFADLFNLKRASIGAYEEGRAEPKLSTIIEIANHFGISVDDLLKKDLSVNDLYHFDIFRKDLIKGAKHNLRPSKLPPSLIGVPLITQLLKLEYLADRESLTQMGQLSLPLSKGLSYRAFELADNSMLEQGMGFGAGDIVIAYKESSFNLSKTEQGKIYLFETAEDWKLRRLKSLTKELMSLSAISRDYYEEEVLLSAIVDLWQVDRVITKNISSVGAFQEQIDLLKSEILKLSK
tara:strand:+ start:147565 stop:148329 length:765 start_codon:yes stop_codon:yes gene_type:complete